MNINGDKIENNLTACFFKRESRQKAIEHIAALCRKAKTIYVYDKYSFQGGANVELLKAIFPTKQLTLFYDYHYIDLDMLRANC